MKKQTTYNLIRNKKDSNLLSLNILLGELMPPATREAAFFNKVRKKNKKYNSCKSYKEVYFKAISRVF